ncbi:MAG: Thivi_2564 family membrane protein [Legionellaceae bacterium]|nr:Thivi_2564 family membrane protein [Legionellaceae bacterium]
MMSLVNLIVLIVLAGVILWGINAFIPMPPLIKSLLNFLVFIVLVIYILQFFNVIKMILPFPTIFK